VKNSADVAPYVRHHHRTLNDRLAIDSGMDMQAENTNPWG